MSISASPRPIRPRPGEWRTVIAGSDRVYLRGVTAYRDHLAITERVDGLDQLRPAHLRRRGDAHPFRRGELHRRLRQQSRIRAGRLPARLFLDGHAGDGLRLSSRPSDRLETLQGPGNPVGLRPVALCDRAADGRRRATASRCRCRSSTGRASRRTARASSSSTPMAPTAIAIPPSFSTNRISLLDRGYAYAIAHIRGGDDLGYGWYPRRQARQAHQHLQRFRRCREGPDRRRLHQRRAGSRSRAARPAAS